jgi:hypothetical protein
MHAVVIDNQPVLDQAEIIDHKIAKTATLADKGMGDVPPEEDEKIEKEGKEAEDIRDHNLNVREISDAFAEQEIACAFVLPYDEDKDEAKIFNRIMAASKPADIVVIDWYLRDNNAELTKRILAAIAENDAAEKGRLRLICVYTGQTDTEMVIKDSVAALLAGGLESSKIDEEAGCAYGNHHCLLVLNKQGVHGAALPVKILEALTVLSDGILPTFALAAVAAIRRNVHHIITRFSSDLDAAFVGNRLITDPPGDVAELLRELFVSECDTALGLEKVVDNYLEASSITHWLKSKKQPVLQGEYSYKSNNADKIKVKIDANFIDSLLSNGIVGDCVNVKGDNKREFREDKRQKVSHALHGGKSDAKTGESNFARFVSLKREAFGNLKRSSAEKWLPSLTLGTLLRQQVDTAGEKFFKYYYCLTPACDTIRLNGKQRTFQMLEIEQAKGMTNLLVTEEGETCKKLFIDAHPKYVRTFNFKGDDITGRVQASQCEDAESRLTTFLFNTADDTPIELFWLGEVRRNRANRDMADLNRQWLRFGIHDSEYLRLAAKGKADT